MKYIKILLFFMFFLIIATGNSKAVLQSNGNTAAKYNVDDWMTNVRKMEELGGAMGLSETLNDNLTASSDSNNIDVHMQKNTEFGALAILSASSYGNPNSIADGETTTGNITGVVMNLNKEWVAAGTLSSTTVYKNAVNRYKNVYTDTYVAKKGDAITETEGWHGSTSSVWISSIDTPANQVSGLLRNHSGSIFSYYGAAVARVIYPYTLADAHYSITWSSRAVVVMGDGV